jgi:hypothetical protein
MEMTGDAYKAIFESGTVSADVGPQQHCDMSAFRIPGDYCANCRQEWPCNCDDPVQICGICDGTLTYDCHCDERNYVSNDCPF